MSFRCLPYHSILHAEHAFHWVQDLQDVFNLLKPLKIFSTIKVSFPSCVWKLLLKCTLKLYHLMIGVDYLLTSCCWPSFRHNFCWIPCPTTKLTSLRLKCLTYSNVIFSSRIQSWQLHIKQQLSLFFIYTINIHKYNVC